jgi:ABC-type enterochelin transport system substrate-binding protein
MRLIVLMTVAIIIAACSNDDSQSASSGEVAQEQARGKPKRPNKKNTAAAPSIPQFGSSKFGDSRYSK